MGKKKNGAYNDFLDGEKLSDNTEIRTSLHSSTPLTRNLSPPPSTSTFTSPHPNNPSSKTRLPNNAKPNKKPPPTHFLCLPLCTLHSLPQFQSSLSNLRSALPSHTPLLPASTIRPPSTLHLTLAVLSLTPTTLSSAISHLQDINLHTLLRDITHSLAARRAAESGTVSENLNAAGMPDTDALCVDVRGLKSMHDNDGKGTGCLYAEVLDKTGRVEEFSASVRAEFERVGGMLVDEGRGLKLHATVLNTIYAKREILRARKKGVDGSGGGAGGGGGGGGREREDGQMQSEERAETGEKEKEKERSNNDDKDTTSHRPKSSNPLRFDARDLIQQYKDCTWATDVKIDRVCLCKMGARKVWSGGAEGVGEVVDEVYEVVAEKKIFV